MVKGINRRNTILILWLLLFLGVSVWVVTATRKETIFSGSCSYLKEGWQIYGDKENGRVTYVRGIDEVLSGKTVGFYAYDAYVDAEAEGLPLYHWGENSRYLKSPGSSYHFIDIPEEYAGKQLSIIVQHVYQDKYHEAYEFEAGRSADLFIRHLKKEMGNLIINIILIGLSVILFFLYFLQRINKQKIPEALFLGLLTVCFVFWSGGNTFIHQFLFPYAAERYYLYYFTLYSLPVLIICYLEALSRELDCKRLFYAYFLLIGVIVALHFTKVAEMTQTLIWYCVFAGIGLIIVTIKLFRTRNLHDKMRFYAFILWIVTILINALWYMMNAARGVSIVLSKIGMCVYVFVVVLQSVREMINNMAAAKNAELLKVKAYTDSLTGLGNRYAFDEQIRQEELTRLAIVSLDVNNLKYYNDTYGHMCGDKLIAETARILRTVFGTVYRVGGDEFIALLADRNGQQMEEYKAKVRALSNRSSTEQMKIEIACGYSMYREGDASFEDILRRADTAMYDDKKQLKSENGL